MSWCVFVWWCLMIGGVGWIECFEGFGSSWFFRSCVLQTNTEAHQRKERDSGHLDKLSESGACRELVQRYGVKHIKTNEQWNIQILKRRMNFCLQCYCSPVTLWFPSSNCQVGANKNQAMRNGLTPLMAACLQGHEEAGAQSSLEKSRFWAFFSYLAVFGVPPIFRHTHNIHIYTHVYIRIYIYIYTLLLLQCRLKFMSNEVGGPGLGMLQVVKVLCQNGVVMETSMREDPHGGTTVAAGPGLREFMSCTTVYTQTQYYTMQYLKDLESYCCHIG